MQGENAVLNVLTIPPGATTTSPRIVLDGVRGALFVYGSGGPLGALIGSWAGQAGTDPYGNVYPAGISVTTGTIQASQFIATGTTGQYFGYSTATPALNALVFSIATASGTDSAGNGYVAGATVYFGSSGAWQAISLGTTGVIWYTSSATNQGTWVQAGVMSPTSGAQTSFTNSGNGFTIGTVTTPEYLGLFKFSSGAPATLSNRGILYAAASGALAEQHPSGLGAYAFDRTQVSSGSPLFSAGNTTALTNFSPLLTIPSADIVQQATYEIEIQLSGTGGQTTIAGFTIQLSLNGTGVVSSSIGTVLFSAVSQNFSATLKGTLTVISTGSSGTAHAHMTGVVGNTSVNRGGSTQATAEGGSSTVAINTTVSNTLQMVFNWGAAGGSNQIANCWISKFIRKSQ